MGYFAGGRSLLVVVNYGVVRVVVILTVAAGAALCAACAKGVLQEAVDTLSARFGSEPEQVELIQEFTQPVLGDDYLSTIQIVPPEGSTFDYVAKYQSGAAAAQELCPAPCTEEEHRLLGETALKLHHALGLSVYSRADFILDAEGRPWCLEVNTLPGMTPTSLLPQEAAAVGIGYPELCEIVVRYALER